MAIKSLPQEWLWCETWCDEHSKKKAKTIDLCNNPQTKEPKLTAARRIVKEWQDYDNELKTMLQDWQNKQGDKTNVSQDDGKFIEAESIASQTIDHNKHQELWSGSIWFCIFTLLCLGFLIIKNVLFILREMSKQRRSCDLDARIELN